MEKIIDKIKENNYIFIGEIHGTGEIPKKIIKLVKILSKTNKIIFCVELPKQIEQGLNNFLNKKINIDKLFSSKYLKDALFDNRLNSNIIDVYKQLNNINVKIKGLDDYYLIDINKRDENMASTLQDIISKEKADLFIIYVGNIHVLDKSIKIGDFIVNPIKIYLNKEILNKSLTIQFKVADKESIILDDDTKTFNWNLKLKTIKANKFKVETMF